MKLNVSPHSADSWTWSLVFDEQDWEDGESGYYVVIEKGHPGWELVRQVVSRIPFPGDILVMATSVYKKLSRKHVHPQVRLQVPDEVAMVLCRSLWLECTADFQLGEEEGE